MPDSVQRLLALQLSEHHLQCALFDAHTLVRHEELPLYPSATDALARAASWLEGKPTRVLAAVSPRDRLLRVSSARGTPFTALTVQLALPPDEEPVFTACNAQNGDPTECRGLFPRLLAAAPLKSLQAARAFFADGGLRADHVFEATYVQLGALTLARETISTPVLVWDVGATCSHFITLDQRGILSVDHCPVGIDQILAAIRATLGLRFATAATKLFLESTYDFSEEGPKIVRRFLPELRKCVTRLPVGPKYFHITGLGRDQRWLTFAIAEAWCLQPLEIDWAAYGRAHGVAFASRELAASLPPSFGGLLMLAKHRDSPAPAWQARWSDEPKPVRPPAPAPAVPEKPAGHGIGQVLSALSEVFVKPKSGGGASAKPARQA